MRVIFKLIFLFSLCLMVSERAFAQNKTAFGWVEKARIYPGNIVIHAKLDTGADSSSLDGSLLEEFDKDGKKWVRFDVANRYGRKVTIEKEVHRVAMVKRHSGKPQRRNVIRIGICLGQDYMETYVSLVDRRNFDYQMLIGRSFLAGHVIVDSAVAYTADPDCGDIVPVREIRPKKRIKKKIKKKTKKTKKVKTVEKVADKADKADKAKSALSKSKKDAVREVETTVETVTEPKEAQDL